MLRATMAAVLLLILAANVSALELAPSADSGLQLLGIGGPGGGTSGPPPAAAAVRSPGSASFLASESWLRAGSNPALIDGFSAMASRDQLRTILYFARQVAAEDLPQSDAPASVRDFFGYPVFLFEYRADVALKHLQQLRLAILLLERRAGKPAPAQHWVGRIRDASERLMDGLCSFSPDPAKAGANAQNVLSYLGRETRAFRAALQS